MKIFRGDARGAGGIEEFEPDTTHDDDETGSDGRTFK
jgi:hypothetical protein